MDDWSKKPPVLANLLELTSLVARARRVEMLQKTEAVRQSIASMPVTQPATPLPRVTTAFAPKLQHLKVTSTRRSRF